MGFCCDSCFDKITEIREEEGLLDEDEKKCGCCCCCKCCKCLLLLLFLGLLGAFTALCVINKDSIMTAFKK
ncbi:ORF112 [Agrotis segetum granulovirus]|uniref:ORF112 n=1 Tax=Agrotis segetum granulosis virus TaxID=10464 RepID=Q6QXH2_GVAS|nr:ORF112 [Agrotis segetum granulovirus]